MAATYILGNHQFFDMSKPPDLLRSVVTYRTQPMKDGYLIVRGGTRAPMTEIITLRDQPNESLAYSQWEQYNVTANNKAIVSLQYDSINYGNVLVDDVMPLNQHPYFQVGLQVGVVNGSMPAGGYIVAVRWKVVKVPD